MHRCNRKAREAAGVEEQMVDKKLLESYRSMREEIEELRYKMEHFGEGDTLVGNSTINDYRSGYPIPQAVVGVDRDRYYRLRERYSKRIEDLEKKCEEVEEYIEKIPDSMTRRIFRMYYIDGQPQSWIAKKVHVAQSVVSEKISFYINSDKNDKKV